MSKLSYLNILLDVLITAGQKMIDAATALKEMFSEPEDTKPKNPACKPLFDATSAKKEEPAKEPEPKNYSFQEVRGVMAALSGKGMKAEAKALLTKYGATRLSEVKEEDYAALVAEAEVLANG